MKANDYRIGNLVNFLIKDEDGGEVKGYLPIVIELRHLINMEELGELKAADLFQPIKLTADYLKQMNFVRDDREDRDGDKLIVWYNGYDIHETEDGDFAFAVYVRGDGSFKGGYSMNYVHEVQNLSHALSGKDIEFKR